MDYVRTQLKEEFTINKIVTVHYFEYAKNFVFEGEKHDFWEFLYVDKGEVEVMADTIGYKLKQGEIIFHKPNEFHNVWANGKVAPNLIVVSFECLSSSMIFFENKIFSINDTEKNLIAQIVNEALEAFDSSLNDPNLTRLQKKSKSTFGCEQMLNISLIHLLISLFRRNNIIAVESRISKLTKKRSDEVVLNKILNYLNENLSRNLSFNEICKYSALGKTNLQTLFKDNFDMGVMEHFKTLKIEEAKKFIRETDLNFSKISEQLGYSSVHYFSRHFKKTTGMNPSQYAYSVKSLLQNL